MAGALSMAAVVTVAAPALAAPLDDEPSARTNSTKDHHNSGSSSTTTSSSNNNDHDQELHAPPGQGLSRCGPTTFFRVQFLKPRNFFVPRTRYTDGPGGEMAAHVTREHEIRAFTELEREKQNELTIRDLVRHLRKQVTPHLELRHMVFTGHDYTRKISDGMYGNMWYRVFGYRVGWAQYSQLGSCRIHRIAHGISSVPARIEGWRYWETKHPMFRGRILSKK
ncbi:hypothetical protein ABZ297_20240 [Nonomuraea sp. NPDC005983]|uniref:hypothetical protein n=1 Tax=Nonomuraea sp. NPDC005983 TaxID=3155595 RepID=UPI0033AFEDFA